MHIHESSLKKTSHASLNIYVNLFLSIQQKWWIVSFLCMFRFYCSFSFRLFFILNMVLSVCFSLTSDFKLPLVCFLIFQRSKLLSLNLMESFEMHQLYLPLYSLYIRCWDSLSLQSSCINEEPTCLVSVIFTV